MSAEWGIYTLLKTVFISCRCRCSVGILRNTSFLPYILPVRIPEIFSGKKRIYFLKNKNLTGLRLLRFILSVGCRRCHSAVLRRLYFCSLIFVMCIGRGCGICVVRARYVVDIGHGSCFPTRNLDSCAKLHGNVDACVNGKRGKGQLISCAGWEVDVVLLEYDCKPGMFTVKNGYYEFASMLDV